MVVYEVDGSRTYMTEILGILDQNGYPKEMLSQSKFSAKVAVLSCIIDALDCKIPAATAGQQTAQCTLFDWQGDSEGRFKRTAIPVHDEQFCLGNMQLMRIWHRSRSKRWQEVSCRPACMELGQASFRSKLRVCSAVQYKHVIMPQPAALVWRIYLLRHLLQLSALPSLPPDRRAIHSFSILSLAMSALTAVFTTFLSFHHVSHCLTLHFRDACFATIALSAQVQQPSRPQHLSEPRQLQ